MTRAVRLTLAAIALCATCVAALAQRGAPEDGIDFVTVGAPGNAPIVLPQLNGIGPLTPIGAVDRSFRVTRNEVTASQWLGFIDAYRPHLMLGDYGDPQFTGRAAQYAGVGSDGLPQYIVSDPQYLNRPVTPSWTYIARFMNWLHNGAKPIHEATYEDFHTGAYNMDEFGSGTSVVRQESARFFMMNYDEWTKAVYFDPNRYGEGQPGYWMYPNQSDEPLIPGPPGEGETSGGWGWGTGGFDAPPPVGAYGIETPWGLLDASGGQSEWVETFGPNFPPEHPLLKPIAGSHWTHSGGTSMEYDQIGWLSGAGISSGLHGFRIATFVPCPDANDDSVVNFADLNAVLAGFGQSGEDIGGDVNGDGTVNFGDLNEVLAAFGTTCE